MEIQLTYPLIAMILLTFIVAVKMFCDRVIEMRENKIHPQSISIRAYSGTKLKNSKASDNFTNLFELPVIFYLLIVLFLIFKNATDTTIILAWAFVVMRFVHSFIHTTYNKVMHRFYAFVTGVTLLACLAIHFTLQLF